MGNFVDSRLKRVRGEAGLTQEEFARSLDRSPKFVIDAELVLHTMIEYPNYDGALLVTGDGDFYCLIDYLKRQGKLLKLMVPNRFKFSSLLKKWIPDITFMNDLRGKLEFQK